MKKTILFFTLLTLVVFSSCDKGDLKKKDYDKKEWDKDYEKDKENCFDLVYPITYSMPDGSTITGNEDEIWDALKTWYDTNDSEEKPSLQYPVDVIFEDGDGGPNTETIANEDEMIVLKKNCDEEKYWGWECFKLVYPITYSMPDGSTIMGNEDEIWDALKTWYEAHPDSEEKANLQYPVEVIFEDDGGSATETIANEDDMIALKEDCDDEKYWDWECFELVYPVTYLMPDGSTITGNNEDEIWDALKTWYEAHLDSEEKAQLQYPVAITYDEDNGGTVTETIANEDDMITAKKECED